MSKAKYQGYEALEQVLNEALEQAAAGKGKERHAQDKPFDEQPMQLISELIGDTHGMAFQAIKKLQESLRLPTDRAIREQLGAINYIAGMVIMLRKSTLNLAAGCGDSPVHPLCPHCGTAHHSWTLCQPSFRTPHPPAQIYATGNPTASVAAITQAVNRDYDTSLTTWSNGDTVPLKQYNNLLARYTELEKRLLEVPSAR